MVVDVGGQRTVAGGVVRSDLGAPALFEPEGVVHQRASQV
jgi:hypothetical protein